MPYSNAAGWVAVVVFATLLLALSACAKPTGYSDRNAVTTEGIGKNTYKIDAVGNDRTPGITVYEFAMLKASEIALENGHTAFRIITRQGWTAERGYAGADFLRGTAVRLRIETAIALEAYERGGKWLSSQKVYHRFAPEHIGKAAKPR